MSQQNTSDDVQRGSATITESPMPAVYYNPDRADLATRFELHRLAYQRRLPQTISRLVAGYKDFVMDEKSGMTVYQHLLTTATLAEEDGASDESIVCALLHDIGVFFVVDDHAELSASILRPFVSEENYWILKHHNVANKVHFSPPDFSINRLQDHPTFPALMRFTTYDVNGYVPQPHQPWSHFEPLLEPLFMNRKSANKSLNANEKANEK